MAFCIKCGNELKEGELFCPKCGNKVYQAEETDSVAQVEEMNVNENIESVSENNEQVYHQTQTQPQSIQDNIKQNEVYNDLKNSLNHVKDEVNTKLGNVQSNSGSKINNLESSSVYVLVSGVILAISAFLPSLKATSSWFSLSGYPTEMSLMDLADIVQKLSSSKDALQSGVFVSGILLVILAIATVACAVMKNKGGVIFCGLASGIFGCYQAYMVYKLYSTASDYLAFSTGFYLLIIGSLAIMFTSYMAYIGDYTPNKPKN